MRRKSKSVTEDTPKGGSNSQTHKTKIDDSSTPAEAEQMNDLPKPKVASAADHRLYASICSMEDLLFAPMTSHINILGAPNGSTVVNNFHAGEVRTNLGKTLKKFADAVVSLFEDGPMSQVEFASSWSQTLADTCPRYTFELQGLGPLFSFLFFHCVTAQAKFEASESRAKSLETQLHQLASSTSTTAQRSNSSADVGVQSTPAIDEKDSAIERTPQKPESTTVTELGALRTPSSAAPLETLDTTPLPQGAQTCQGTGSAANIGSDELSVSQQYVQHTVSQQDKAASSTAANMQLVSSGPARPTGEKPAKSTPRGAQRHEAAVEKMLQRKQHRLVPMPMQVPASADGTVPMMMVTNSPATSGAQNREPRAKQHIFKQHQQQQSTMRPVTVADPLLPPSAGHHHSTDVPEDVATTTGGKVVPFASVNGQDWKEFWSMKEKKKMQQKLGLSEPPQDFSNRDVAEYGHQIIKMKDEFLGTTTPLTARGLRSSQVMIEDRLPGTAHECP